MAEPVDVIRRSLIKRSEASPLDYGKLPPQAKDMEEVVLGAIMIQASAINEVIGFLTPETFYLDQHQRIFKAMVQLHTEGSPIDMLTVTEQVIKNGDLQNAGGAYYIQSLTNRIATAANIEYHARILHEKYIGRYIIANCTELINLSYNDTEDVLDIAERSEKFISDLGQMIVAGRVENLKTLVQETANRIMDQIKRTKNKTRGATSKHYQFNKHFMGGYRPGQVIIWAARPSMGKTALMISELMFLTLHKFKAMAFNLEMNEEQSISRMLCNVSRVSNYVAMNDLFTEQQLLDWNDAEYQLGLLEPYLTLDYTPGIHIDQLIAKIRKVKREKGLDVVFIDFLQDVEYHERGTTRDHQIGVIMKRLKRCAKSENVCIVILSHISRETEKRADRRPTLTDLRESGNIEGYADTVLFLVRPDYYCPKTPDGKPDYSKNPDLARFKNRVQIFCDKNRDGTTFSCEIGCKLGISDFHDIGEDAERSNEMENQAKEPESEVKKEGFTRVDQPAKSIFEDDKPPF